jgi:hypothetical protein
MGVVVLFVGYYLIMSLIISFEGPKQQALQVSLSYEKIENLPNTIKDGEERINQALSEILNNNILKADEEQKEGNKRLKSE